MHRRRAAGSDDLDSGVLTSQFLSDRLMQERFFSEYGGPDGHHALKCYDFTSVALMSRYRTDEDVLPSFL